MSSFRFPAMRQLRSAERQSRASLIQLPPRSIIALKRKFLDNPAAKKALAEAGCLREARRTEAGSQRRSRMRSAIRAATDSTPASQ
jgi:hypothetical protein